MMIKRLLITIIVPLFSSLSWAVWDVDEIKTINQVGAHHGPTGFIVTHERVNENCAHQSLYFDITTDLGRSMMSTLITAKASDTKVRVGYSVPSTIDVCTLWMVSLID